tara:strand:- start:357 stop:770 length:414 start_codon:yes stop_codon:yes gene_type:complete
MISTYINNTREVFDIDGSTLLEIHGEFCHGCSALRGTCGELTMAAIHSGRLTSPLALDRIHDAKKYFKIVNEPTNFDRAQSAYDSMEPPDVCSHEEWESQDRFILTSETQDITVKCSECFELGTVDINNDSLFISWE